MKGIEPPLAEPRDHLAWQDATDESIADQALSERERSIRTLVREVVAHEIAPRAAETDRTGAFVHDQIHALCKAGLGGLLFPRRLGGTEDSHVSYAIAVEEIAVGCGATSLVYMTQTHAGYPILLAGSDELQQQYIPGLLDGSSYGSLGITEPGAGSDVSSITTTATPGPDGWTLSGQKTFITTGDKADVIICFATVDRSLGRRGITAFVVDGRWSGVSAGRPFHKLGMHGSSTSELFFDHVDVPRANLLGTEGEGWSVVMSSVVKSRISAAAQGVGLARAAYVRTLAFLRQLQGGRLTDEQNFALADLRGHILQGRLLLHAVAREADANPAVSPGQIGIMKQACTDLGFHASLEAVRILGPHGDLTTLGVERCLRDAKITQIYDGTNEIQRLLIGRETARTVAGLEHVQPSATGQNQIPEDQ